MSEVLKSRPVAFLLGAALTAAIFKFADFPASITEYTYLPVNPRGSLLHLTREQYNIGTVQSSIARVAFNVYPQPLEVKNFRSEYVEGRGTPKDDPRYDKVPLRRYTNAPTYAEDMTNLMLLTSKASDWSYMSAPFNFEPAVFLSPEEIKAGFVVPVWGDAYQSPWGFGTNATFGNKDAVHNRTLLNGGVWYALADERGEFVSPDGQSLAQSEKPYFMQGHAVTLKNDIAETSLTVNLSSK